MPRILIKSLLKPALEKVGLWRQVLRVHLAARWVRKMCYAAAVGLRLGFAVQLRLLPPQFMEKPVLISASSITQCLLRGGLPSYRPVVDGDWDLQAEPLLATFWDLIHFRLMYEMFVENKPHEETSQYKQMTREILTRGETVHHGFRSIEQVVQHLEKYERIFNDIKENGYKTQQELGNPSSMYEIRVSINREGEPLFWGDGTHRVAMAKILDLESVPVNVWNVHRIWAERCFNKYGGGLLKAVCKGLDDIEDCHRDEKMRPGPTNSPESELDIVWNPAEANSRDCQTLDIGTP